MIIVQIIGGLGNQMFQYAFGRQLAILNKTDLKLDITAFETYKLHNYSLNHLNIQADFASKKEIKKLKTNKVFKRFNLNKKSHIIENSQVVNNQILALRGDFYLEGYWQTEKYFKEIEEIIRDDFKIKENLSGKNKDIADMITNCNAVSLHIRRGDYLANQENIKIYSVFGMDYYEKTIQYIAQKINKPHFFIFSDDSPWVKKNLKLDFSTYYVDHNLADKNYEDLRLMSLCQHNITANSSFSWWGAWLNNNPEKIVIAPDKWSNLTSLSNENIVPESWLKIKI